MKFGQRNIMNTLHQHQVFIRFNTYYTHREACIGWFKYISTSITPQLSAKLRVGNLLKTAHLTASKIAFFTTTNNTTVTGSKDDRFHKRMGEINHDKDNEWKEIMFPVFDLYRRRITFVNSDKCISTIAFEVR